MGVGAQLPTGVVEEVAGVGSRRGRREGREEKINGLEVGWKRTPLSVSVHV